MYIYSVDTYIIISVIDVVAIIIILTVMHTELHSIYSYSFYAVQQPTPSENESLFNYSQCTGAVLHCDGDTSSTRHHLIDLDSSDGAEAFYQLHAFMLVQR